MPDAEHTTTMAAIKASMILVLNFPKRIYIIFIEIPFMQKALLILKQPLCLGPPPG